MEAFFQNSLVLTDAVQKEELLSFIPECLSLDTFQDKWAFLAVAMVQTKNLRPKGFPRWTGNDFILTGYRVFVRYTTSEGKRLRGLYILKSETDKKEMALMGNVFTHYNYTSTDIRFRQKNTLLSVQSKQSLLDVVIRLSGEDVQLPTASPFQSWKEARRFAGPLPFTFTYDAAKKEVLLIEGVREDWHPKPVEVVKSEVGFIKNKGFASLVLANAFLVENIPYYWKKGRIDKWKPL